MRRHHGANTVGEDCRLVGRRSRLALDDRFRFRDLKRDVTRQFHSQRIAFVDGKNAGHAFLQIGFLIAHRLSIDHDLVVVLRVHEVEAFAIFIKELEVQVFNESALDLLGGAPALGDLHAVNDAAHVHLRDRRALAGVKVLRGENDVKLAVHVENIALADG
ncbi:hypothetical protein D3C87_971280 [compost metagenome]